MSEQELCPSAKASMDSFFNLRLLGVGKLRLRQIYRNYLKSKIFNQRLVLMCPHSNK